MIPGDIVSERHDSRFVWICLAVSQDHIIWLCIDGSIHSQLRKYCPPIDSNYFKKK